MPAYLRFPNRLAALGERESLLLDVDGAFDGIVDDELFAQTQTGTATYTWSFPVDSMGLFYAPDVNLTSTWLSGDSESGSGGCLQFLSTTAGSGDGRWVASTDMRWTDWGVPPGAIVKSVALTSWSYKNAASTGQTDQQIDIAIINANFNRPYANFGLDFVNSGVDVLPTSATWSTQSGRTIVDWPIGDAQSDSVANLQLFYGYNSSGTTNIDFRLDELQFTITYVQTVAPSSGGAVVLAGIDASLSDQTATLFEAEALVETNAATSGNTGQAVVAIALKATNAAQSGQTASLRDAEALMDTDAASSGNTSQAVVAIALTAGTPALSGESSFLTEAVAMNATIAAQANELSTLTVDGALASTISSQSSQSAVLTDTDALASTDTSTSSESASIGDAIALSDTDSSTSGESGTTGVGVAMTTTSLATSGEMGSIVELVALVATDAAQSDENGVLSTTEQNFASGQSGETSTLSLARMVGGISCANSDDASLLGLLVTFTSTATATSGEVADLNGGAPIMQPIMAATGGGTQLAIAVTAMVVESIEVTAEVLETIEVEAA